MTTVERNRYSVALGMIAAVVLGCLAMSGAYAGEGYSWSKPHAKVLDTGDLQWAPEPFAFVKGPSVRYIDFDGGDDARDGATRRTAWKHHPWDPAAAGKAAACEGVHTYVFKRGVVYRGRLIAGESGRPGRSIRLTSDPSWGTGEAMLWGSVRLPSAWKRASEADMPRYMPNDGKTWYMDLEGAIPDDLLDNRGQPRRTWEPFTLFEIAADGAIRRLRMARDPDWRKPHPSFSHDYWHQWDGFRHGEKVEGKWAGRGGQDDDLKGKPADFFDGGYLWSMWKGNMGTAGGRRLRREHYSPEHGTLFPTGWFVAKGTRYMIENVPAYLDGPDEFYYLSKGPRTGRLFLRLAGDRTPNEAVLEAPVRACLIHMTDRSHVEISGIELAMLDPATYSDSWPNGFADATAIRAAGSVSDITVRNCTFRQVVGAVRVFPRMMRAERYGYFEGYKPDRVDRILIADNDIRDCEREAIMVALGHAVHEKIEADTYAEDWVPGALSLDGKRRGVVTDASLRADVVVNLRTLLEHPQFGQRNVPGEPWTRIGNRELRYPGQRRKTLDVTTTNVLVEAIVRLARNHAGGVIAGKHDGRAGYRLLVTDAGRVAMDVAADGKTSRVVAPAGINDGAWHHVLAETDRAGGRMRIYLDGKPAGEAKLGLAEGASLSNPSDFVVGEGVRGAIDFLRVCQSNLAESRTTIEELTAWQTDGPVTRDFCGRKPVGRRDVGAVERVK